ncbi:50S ribosomal protein L14e [Stygiolobus caldivivus]|uniref:Large ribosomal subunit protein eL14 n=1 Tax=Stygiolobus caldivivus TaxID=2824673 RepID=A0A8D5U6Q1_9CREN|nr:50S ribosomal protein L14e [Stygiolobus caldivivus]BCU70675.1 50S ribosomal protein L14e [Stygiolobus caldivivus]
MPIIEVGRICVKTRGREAGKKCVIVDIIDENYVLVTGPKDVNGVKRRRVNILHLEPTDKKININKGASDDDIKKTLQESGLMDYMKESVKPKIPVI